MVNGESSLATRYQREKKVKRPPRENNHVRHYSLKFKKQIALQFEAAPKK